MTVFLLWKEWGWEEERLLGVYSSVEQACAQVPEVEWRISAPRQIDADIHATGVFNAEEYDVQAWIVDGPRET
jgi:hypothetical protein